ncbi:hypothetical protein [Sporomusa termitida]|nr:hypothetical protein [Sporomusa termitida]
MADNKSTEEKAQQSEQAEKEQTAAKPQLPASARKPGQNYSTPKVNK